MKEIIKTNFIILLILCSCRPDHTQHKKYMNHLGDYIIGDQSKRNEFHKKQAVDDLTGCRMLIALGKWDYSKYTKNLITRHQSWLYSDNIVSEESISLEEIQKENNENQIIYVGPIKELKIDRGFIKKVNIDKRIQFIAYQNKKNHKLYYGFFVVNGGGVKERPIKIMEGLAPDSERFCEVKWIAKYGYNGVLDLKRNQIIEAKE